VGFLQIEKEKRTRKFKRTFLFPFSVTNRNREGVRVSLRVLQSCIVSCEEHELLLLELKERNRDSKEKRKNLLFTKETTERERERVLREFIEN